MKYMFLICSLFLLLDGVSMSVSWFLFIEPLSCWPWYYSLARSPLLLSRSVDILWVMVLRSQVVVAMFAGIDHRRKDHTYDSWENVMTCTTKRVSRRMTTLQNLQLNMDFDLRWFRVPVLWSNMSTQVPTFCYVVWPASSWCWEDHQQTDFGHWQTARNMFFSSFFQLWPPWQCKAV